MILFKERYTYTVRISAILLLLMQRPYFAWGIANNMITYAVLGFILAFIFAKNKEIRDSKKGRFSIFYCLLLSFYILLRINHGATLLGALFYATNYLFVTFINIKKEYIVKVFDAYLSIYSILMGLSLLSWIGVLLGITPALGTIPHYIEDWNYQVYPLCVQLYGFEGIRFCGIFDEPGVVGNVAIILLCISGFNFKDWRIEIVALTGVFSLSLYFYIVVGIFAIWNYAVIRKRIGGALIICVSIFIAYLATKDVPVFYETLWSRLEWDSTKGTITGNDRMTEDAELYYEKIKGTTEYYFGVNNQKYYTEISKGGSSYKNVIATVGAVFMFLYVTFFLYISKKSSDIKTFFLYSLLIITMFYQRISLFNPFWLLVLITYAKYGHFLQNTKQDY